MRVDQFGEFGEYLHDLVGPLATCGHHNDISLALLCDGMLENGLSAAERPGDESGTAFGDGIEGVDAPHSGLHDPLRPGFLLIGLDRDLHRPFLGHGHIVGLAGVIGQHGDHHVDVVTSFRNDFLYFVLAFIGEWDHDLVGEPSFFDLSEPVSGDDLVTFRDEGSEIPEFLMIQRIGVLTSFQEHRLHCGQVVLQPVIHAGEQSGT